MDDPCGIPSDFRHFAATTRTDYLSSSSSFPEPSFSVHRNLPSPPPPPPPAPNSTTYQSIPSFPLVSGGGLVELSASNPDHHHHHHYHHHLISGANSTCVASRALYGSNLINHHHDHDHHDRTLESGGVWNTTIGMNIFDTASNGEANNSRWPRQETLTLLEIRSRLNPKFKDTNQKAPLWDEVSRIMAEEHGYQRSGKKCKEKFENLYKYYKKTKEGKAGRQDGKHYRFFRQLEAIYGDQSGNQSSLHLDTNNLGRSNLLLYDHLHTSSTSTTPNLNRTTNNHESLSFSVNSTEFETSSSENNEDDLSAIAFKMNNHRSMRVDDRKMKGVISNAPSRKPRSSWKAKVEDFVDSQMKKIMVTQETWMENILKSIVDKEEERLAREEEWRRQEAAKFDQEVGEFWAKEKAWVEARDAALMGALKNFRAGEGVELPSFPKRVFGKDHNRGDTIDYVANYHRWSEEEISSLMEVRSNFEETFQGVVNEYVKDVIWEEIASKMACLGYDRNALECKEKWENVSIYVRMTSECKKKRKEDYYNKSCTSTANYFDDHDQVDLKQDHDHQRHDHHMGLQLMDEGLSPSSSTGGTQMQPNSCFHLLFGEGENLWEKCGSLKLSKDKMNQQMYNK